MINFLKNFKAFWFLELLLFAGGFFLVYNEFVSKSQDPDAVPGAGVATAPALVDDSSQGQYTVLETAVVCLDIDVERRKPLLAKGRFSKHIDALFCYTEVSGKIPNTLFHDWIYDDGVPFRQKVRLNGSDRIGWTKMTMSPSKEGTWRVEIRTDDGQFIGSADFVLK